MTAARQRWHRHADPAQLAVAVAKLIAEQAQQAIQARGAYHLVLAGGSTPRGIYECLAQRGEGWDRWAIFFGDERCAPLGDPQRNDVMARDAWLAHVPIPQSRVHSIPAELGPTVGARRYREILADVDDFDLVMLGLGEDGHTASLFPGACAGRAADSPDALAIVDAPKPPGRRVSLSAHRLGRTRQLLLVATGESKRAALAQLRSGADIPAAAIQPEAGMDVHTDQRIPQ